MATYRTRRRSDGTTAHQVIYRDPDRGNKQTSLTFDDEHEAQLFKRFLEANGHSYRLAEQAVVQMRSQAPTLNELITHHLDTLTGVEPGTIEDYRGRVRLHVEDTIGRVRLDALDRNRIIDWLQGINLAPKSLKNIHSIVSAALQTGVHDEAWPVEANPAFGVRMPKGGGKKRVRPLFMTRDQVDELISAVRRIHDEFTRPFIGFDPGLFVDFQAESGMRPSESTAVRAHVDTTTKADGRIIIHVSEAWKARETGLATGDTKTAAGVRDVPLSVGFSEQLRPHLEALAPGALLWGNRQGQRLHQGWWYDAYWNPARLGLVGAGVLPRRPRFYDLRHTHVSWLIDRGVPLPVIARRVGHEDISTTVNVYGHLATGADERAADALNRLQSDPRATEAAGDAEAATGLAS